MAFDLQNLHKNSLSSWLLDLIIFLARVDKVLLYFTEVLNFSSLSTSLLSVKLGCLTSPSNGAVRTVDSLVLWPDN